MVTMSWKQFNELGDDELRRACIRPVADQIRGKSMAVKSEAIARLNRSQKALFMYSAWHDHAKHSPMELYCWSAHILSQPGYAAGVWKALRFFGAETMHGILEELRLLLDVHVVQQGRALSEVTFKDLELDDKLCLNIENCYGRFMAEAPDCLQKLAQYIRAHADDFISFLPKEGES